MKRAVTLLAGLLLVIFGWHFFLTLEAREEAKKLGAGRAPANTDVEVSINPVTNVVSIELVSPLGKQEGDPLVAFGAALEKVFGEALYGMLEPAIERDLNLKARERFDLYAIILPYRVRIAVPEREKT